MSDVNSGQIEVFPLICGMIGSAIDIEGLSFGSHDVLKVELEAQGAVCSCGEIFIIETI